MTKQLSLQLVDEEGNVLHQVSDLHEVDLRSSSGQQAFCVDIAGAITHYFEPCPDPIEMKKRITQVSVLLHLPVGHWAEVLSGLELLSKGFLLSSDLQEARVSLEGQLDFAVEGLLLWMPEK